MDPQQQVFDTSFNIPPIPNPPTQFFGADSQDTSPLLPDFGFGDEFEDGQNDDGMQQGGGPRLAYLLDTANDIPSAKYIEGLENRLGRMENLLRMSGLLTEDGEKTDLGTLEKQLANRQGNHEGEAMDRSSKAGSHSRTLTSPQSPPQTENEETTNVGAKSPEAACKEKEAEVEELSDMMCSLVTNNCGETRYIGSSSGFSIFSPKGIQWVNEKTGDTSFQDMITSASVHDIKWTYWKPEVFSDLFTRQTFQPLPPKDEANSLLRDYFENFNFDRYYSLQPYDASGWWASFNVALAIAHRLRVMSHLVSQDEDKKAWGYLKNAMGVLTELTMRNTDLLSVQALLGMALFLLGTPNPQPSFFLVAAAIRLAHSMGLHKKGSGFNLNAVEIEQRKRVFWIAYIIDKDICLRSGRPPAQDDDDMNVELPTSDPSDNIGNIPLADGKGKANLFRFMVEFAVIENKVYKHLYSTKAAKQSDGDLLNTIGELDKELEEWKDSIPIDFRPEHEIKASHTPLVLHVVVLHFAYYNCLTTIHRMSVHHGYWTSRLSNYALQGLNARPLNPRVFSSATLCVQAARASIQLIRYIPQGDYSCVWLILYFPVSALVTLFANVLQNPQDPRARSDIKLMNQVVNFLSLLSVTEEQGGVKRMLGVCTEFERIARVVLEQSDKSKGHRRRPSKLSNGTENNSVSSTPQQIPQKRLASSTPSTNDSPNSQNLAPPSLTGTLTDQSFNPSLNSFSPTVANINLPLNFTNNSATKDHSTSPSINGANTMSFADLMNEPSSNPMAGGAGSMPMPDMNQFPTDDPMSPLNMGAFQQPFVPQDLWNMPMTLEWDWADMNIEGFGVGPPQQESDQNRLPPGVDGSM
ncbi:uncharacterized protein KY384_001050 [Bacidia gigantensis]|uniref:uncharacterized protein n=1 Tax=Bacidia gigantensis TaxID=2732470 RepID=UPI001D04DAC2|nr:uncharacterized protein KY384_001050 [Bacidia gigantensis]KAG8534206.1 hypothetical protein KY384_001050 [Bacidia gigantensis]